MALHPLQNDDVNLSSTVVDSMDPPIILKFSSKQSDLFIDVCPCFQADHWCLCHFFHVLQFGGSESSYGTRLGDPIARNVLDEAKDVSISMIEKVHELNLS